MSWRKLWIMTFNFKKVLLILIFILIVVLVFNKAGKEDNKILKRPLPLGQILDGSLTAKSFNGSFVSQNEVLFRDVFNNAILFNLDLFKQTILLSNKHELANGTHFWLSPDKKYLLVSRKSFYDILNLDNNTVTPIRVGKNKEKLTIARWNPVTNGIVFVFNNDIYYKATPESEPIRVTFDSKSENVLNGIPDWVYQEEVLSSNSAIWFSPDGTKFAFAKFKENSVHEFGIPVYGNPGNPEFKYPKYINYRYPVPGTSNPKVELYFVNIDILSSIKQLQYIGKEPEQILAAVDWLDENHLMAIWLNRVQNKSEFHIYDCEKATCMVIKTLESTTGWLEFFTNRIPNKDGSKVAIILSTPVGNDSFPHLSLINTTDGTIETLTQGPFTVVEILKWGDENNVIFYLANTESNSEYLHVYAIPAKPESQSQCLSCDVVRDGVQQTYFTAEMNPGKSNFIALSAIGPSVPQTNISKVSIGENATVTLTNIIEWEKNDGLNEQLKTLGMPTIIKDSFPIGTDMKAQVIMLLPPGLDQNGSKKYPMLVEVYGGPGFNNYLDTFGVSWGSYLASNKSIIYVKIDGRGSGLRGENLMHEVYKKLGTVEIEDQIMTTRNIANKYKFVDPKRIGIWGWSYGGYASAMALANDNQGTFKCAASVAPVTDWIYYDTIYTERYMGLPIDNKEGYQNASLSALANSFKNKTFLLVHGTEDNNVHYQQSMVLAGSLEKNDIYFEQISYPDENHGLVGVRPHLYHSLGRFFNQCFGLGNDFF